MLWHLEPAMNQTPLPPSDDFVLCAGIESPSEQMVYVQSANGTDADSDFIEVLSQSAAAKLARLYASHPASRGPAAPASAANG